jgi:hypothetical protein
MMGYCDPTWVSDYTFNALFNRLKAVNGAFVEYPPALIDRTWARARVDTKGNVKFLSSVFLHHPPLSNPKTIVVETANGPEKITGNYFEYDHLDGGVILWPETALQLTGITIEMGGKSFHVTP